jgi:hypothetical protein
MSKWMLAAIAGALLNVLDAILTMAWIHVGAATEANPILAPIFTVAGATTFLLIKFLTCFLWVALADPAKRGSLLARSGIGVGVAVYTGLLCYHILSGVGIVLNLNAL